MKSFIDFGVLEHLAQHHEKGTYTFSTVQTPYTFSLKQCLSKQTQF